MSNPLADLAAALGSSSAAAATPNYQTTIVPAMGVVEGINADGTLSVVVNGVGSGVPAVCGKSYVPNVGDTVFCLYVNNAVVFVVDTVADSQSIGGPWQPGDIKLRSADDSPVGWLLCDGSAVSRTEFSRLFAVMAAMDFPWGNGDGSTTFNVPDLAGRFVMGAGDGDYAFGSSGGATDALLQGTDLPVHAHTLSAASWTGSVSGTITGGSVSGLTFSEGTINGLELSGSPSLSGNTGAGTAHYHGPESASNFITDQESDFTGGSAESGSGVSLPSEIYYGTTSETTSEESHTHPLSGGEVSMSGVSVEYSSVTGTISGGTISGQSWSGTVTGTIGGETDEAGSPAAEQTAVPTLPPFTVLSYFVKT